MKIGRAGDPRFARRIFSFFLAGFLLFQSFPSWARPLKAPPLTARSAIIVDARNGGILFSKNPHLRLPPASTTKLMTVVLALERLPLHKKVKISREAFNVEPSKAGLNIGVEYTVYSLAVAALVASSNDAAVALAEAVAGTEAEFTKLMNQKAKAFGMNNTRFVNATGLTVRGRTQYSTVYDLTRLMRYASGSKVIDQTMGITAARITGNDGQPILIKSHNKMLWRTPKFVKGKTGWTFAARHTFVGTNYEPQKQITFAMLASREPWIDIKRLASFGLLLKSRK